ncbi:MAG: COX15/CtaA family protein [Parvibaculum sp.]|uniref:COX15/CtaA family protein n=1 Tax=Parvibaculum sp. TaxID=2024848 RepID=UPI002846979B|nr:COX15/CtaA family protein [Parvibaculum sp.]MDR3500375.1 COX15/CtaA family protein [Parvibaculum sp.]
MNEASLTASRRQIAIWLFGVCGLVFAMVIVGGLTRLTESGLSITEWKPVMGALPPLSDAAWQDAFQKYQQIPQYEIVNKGMTLADFKSIFWWEWSHRLLGRLIGFAFALPFLWFLATRKIERRLAPQLAVMFVLGGAQGALGWWMVKSGLSDRVDVSQYRLVAHLGLATAIYAYMLWVALGLWGERKVLAVSAGLRRSALALVPLVFAQMMLGGFVAGLKAGYIYNTWPLINGAFVPEGLFAHEPWWRNFFESALTAQFDHRMLAYAVAVLALSHWIAARLSGSAQAAQSATWLAVAVLVQVLLGIWALIEVVPVSLGAAHQAGAMVVFTLAIVHARRLSRA